MTNNWLDTWGSLYHALAEPLSWVLIHFLWQGALGAVLLAGALYLLRTHSARVRYAVSLATLVGLLTLPAVTWWMLPSTLTTPDGAGVALHAAPVVTSIPAPAAQAASASAPASWINQVSVRWMAIAPWVVSLWMAGVAAGATRMLGGWLYTRRLRRQAQPITADWRRRIDALAERVGVQRPVDVRQSRRVEVPMVAGWWRPVLLTPVGVLTGLPPAQVEAILAHELAHIRRHDVLVGWLQAVAETLLFYHPAVWWVSRQVRTEREHCCDDVAVAASASRATYARALTALEERRPPRRPSLALAASDGSLLQRIRRLVERPARPVSHERVTGAVASLLVAGGLLIVGACTTAQTATDAQPSANAQPSETEASRAAVATASSDTSDDRRSRRVYLVRDSSDAAAVKGWADSTEGRAPRVEVETYSSTSIGAAPDSLRNRLRAFTLGVDTFVVGTDTVITGPRRAPRPPDAPTLPDWYRFEAPRMPQFESDSLRFPDPPKVLFFEGDTLRIPQSPSLPELGKLDSLQAFNDGFVRFFRSDSLPDLDIDSLRHRLESKAHIYMREMMQHEEKWKERGETLQREMEQVQRALRQQMEEREHELEAYQYKLKRKLNRELPERLREQAEALRRQAEQLEEEARELETRRDTSGTRER